MRWDEIFQDFIARCWVKSGIFPASDDPVLMQFSDNVKQTKMKEKFPSDIVFLFGALALDGRAQSLDDYDIGKVKSSDLEDWLDVKLNDHMHKAMVEDAMD